MATLSQAPFACGEWYWRTGGACASAESGRPAEEPHPSHNMQREGLCTQSRVRFDSHNYHPESSGLATVLQFASLRVSFGADA